MKHPAITVEKLSKAYRIGVKEEAPDTLAGAISGMARRPLANLRKLRRLTQFASGEDAHDTLWALRDVSFEVGEGEVVGIIGRNGAGKSTLLKILSRITEPTSGRAVIRGRISSLLEVGTGFHPELTGRENIYMNGTILGMTKREIDRKFDEIVDFSGVEKFLDTPVKRYSSGMTVRLAFAVAAHLEPEILIIDEVLAVGDGEFQKKCLGKMQDVARGGRTVLFVSHNMAAVEGLCRRGIVLSDGRIAFDGAAREAVGQYHNSLHPSNSGCGHRFNFSEIDGASHNRELNILELRITSNGVHNEAGYVVGAPLEFHLDFIATRPIKGLVFCFGIHGSGNSLITGMHTKRHGGRIPETIEGACSLRCRVEDLLLIPGEYSVSVGIKAGGDIILVSENAGRLAILTTDLYGTGYAPDPGRAIVLCRQTWAFNSVDRVECASA